MAEKPVAFIFDMDGVIVDSNPFHKIALKQFCKKHGKELTEDELRERIYGRTNRDWIIALFGEIGDEQLSEYAAEKEALFRELYKDDITAVAGIREFLEKVHTLHVPVAIATSAPLENVDFTLDKTGLRKHFPVILYDKFVTRGKPHPEIYLKTAAAVGVDPSRCIVFEDSLSGIESARNAGCRVVGITTTHDASEMGGIDVVISDFAGLKPEVLINRLF